MLMFVACQAEQEHAMQLEDWHMFQQRFITAQGRVMDDAQNHATHSEGQGYAMLLALAFNDRETFDRLWRWSRKHLQVRQHDHLLAWLWDPKQQHVADTNNATDGDVIAAWALLRAAKHWDAVDYALDAKEILKDLTKLEVEMNGFLLLLPASQGFQTEQSITINPSYFIFPAYRELASLDTTNHWQRLYHDALAVLEHARFGLWELPPDWLDVSAQGISVAKNRPAWFSYDAIRIPLHTAWGGESTFVREFVAFWQQFSLLEKVQPDRVDLLTDFVHFDHQFKAGKAVYELCLHTLDPSGEIPHWPQLQWRDDTSYFDASLMLLSQMAWLEFRVMDEQHE